VAPPVPILDKLWSEILLAIGNAPPQVRAVMVYRSECLFALLIDNAGGHRHESDPTTWGLAFVAYMASRSIGSAGTRMLYVIE
jgi:hypothetical protein